LTVQLFVERFGYRPVKPNHPKCYDRTAAALLRTRFPNSHTDCANFLLIIVPSAALCSRGRPSLPKRIGLQFVRASHVLHMTAQDSRKDPYLSMPAEPLITTYLEMRSADQLRPKRADPQFQVSEKTESDWRFNRDLTYSVSVL